ncbi:MAG: hypothetical protein KDB22_24000 [Planctomycetales bacterium]|nr:hypothetical protein [Planctomycetales bacterium]
MKPVPIAIIGEFSPSFEPHGATNAAIEHASNSLKQSFRADWISTEDVEQRLLESFAGILIAPGSPYASLSNALNAIRFARENNLPCLGTCGGFQHIILEYARNVLGFDDAQHAEYDPFSSQLFVSKLDCSLVGRRMRLQFVNETRVARIYQSLEADEQYYCNFGVNPQFVDLLRSGPLQIVGKDAEGEVRVVELPDHPFFVGTLFVPQLNSTSATPHPLIKEFLRVAAST